MTRAVPQNAKIEALRAAVDRFDFKWDTEDVLALTEAARALVAEYDEQTAYVQYLMDNPPDPAAIQRLMTTTDPETVTRVISTVSAVAQPGGQAHGTLDP